MSSLSNIAAAAIIIVLVTTSHVLGLGLNYYILSPSFYETTCPDVSSIVRVVVEQAHRNDRRVGPKLLRVHFHDCFVNGCDGSLLLDNADGIESEKDARPNLSTEGYDVVDAIKAALENVCPGVVSCADILAIASQILVSMNGGPTWEVALGRRDSRMAYKNGVTANIPTPLENLGLITQKFINAGLDSTDLVALSGAHSFGRAKCVIFVGRLYNFNNTGKPDPSLDPSYLKTLRQMCPLGGDNRTLVKLDPTTPYNFDNNYFKNLQKQRGLLQSDQELYSTSGAETVAIVNRFANSQSGFFDSFAKSMIKMGNINPLTGSQGEIRSHCRRIN